MASLVVPAILAFILASCTRGDSQKGSDEMDMLEVMKKFKIATAILSTIDDPNQKCLVAKRGAIDLDNGCTNFTWHYQGLDGSPKTKCFYNEVDKSQPDVFYMAPCDECMLWVTTDAKKNVPELCEKKFKEKCKVDGNVLYDKESCK